MNEMERVGSSAMKSLAAYADSDEEEDELSKQNAGDSGMDDDDPQRLDSITRHRTLSTAEIAKAQLPEAPDSYGEEEDGAGSATKPKRNSSMNIYDDDDDDGDEGHFRRSPLISDEFDDGNDNEKLVEPPPPARPKAFNSPSPSSSRGSTPQIVRRSGAAAFPREPSSQALVSYSAEDDDENAQRKSLEKGGDQVGKRSLSSRVLDDGLLLSSNEGSIGGELSRPASDRSHKSGKSEGTMDDIDVDELLEKPLEAGGTPQFSEGGSPSDQFSIDSIQIPPPPAEKCSEELQAKFRQYLERKRKDGYNFNAVILGRTDFRNPSIYEKLIEHFGIDEVGTNFPKNVYDPHGFKSADYYDEVAKAQRIMMDKLERATEKDKPKPPVVPGQPEEKKRKSKWDN